MRIRILTLLTGLLISATAIAQTRAVSGSVIDTTGNPLSAATVNLKSATENLSVKTNTSGKYNFPSVSSTEFIINITSIGFENYTQSYVVGNIQGKAFIIDPVKLNVKTNELAAVVITVSPITIKEDTIEYRADAYKVREGAPVEDMLKKLPGVSVDKDGVITAQGKEVKRVRVNGKDYFGGDVITATQNLPADVIENVQIIDDYGDKANQTGVKEGEPEKVLNFNVKRGMNKGSFGNGNVGIGTKDRYVARINANNFKEDRQISFIGSLNNTNANSFNFNGGGRGGGARGANFGGGERGGAGADGTTFSTSLGFNYRDSWSKKLTSYGSYSFSSRNNKTTSTSFSQDINPDNINSTRRDNVNSSNSLNHRLTWNLEYKIDSANYLKVTPYFSYASSENSSNGVSEYFRKNYYTLSNGKSNSLSTTPAFGSDLFYIHRFKRKGRNFNVSATMNYSARDQERESQNTYDRVDSSSGFPVSTQTIQNQFTGTENVNTTTNVRLSFAEPISKYTALEASYTWNNSETKSIRDVSDVDMLTGEKFKNLKQSNDYQYNFVTNRYGLNLHSNKTKYNYYVGIVLQPSKLTGFDKGRNITTVTNNFNYAPNARFAYNFSRSHSLTASYNGNSREPSFTQLQPVSDSSNLQNIVSGNPDLKPEFTNRFSLQYSKVNIQKGSSLFANVSFDETQNKIVSSRVTQPTGTGRTTTYLNTDGFYGLNGNISLTQPFLKKKLTATINTNGSYDNNISFAENVKNTGQNWTIRPGARLRVDFTDIIDINISGNYSYNKNTINYPEYTKVGIVYPAHTYTSEVKTTTLSLEGKNFFFKNWTLGYELSKLWNTGYANVSSQNTNPLILTSYIERRFLKNNKGTLRIQGFDLLNQNTGLSRDINGSIETISQNNRLGRYFLLTFNLRLQKFAGRQPNRLPGDRMNNQNNPNRGQNGGQRNGQGRGNN
jgi:hypothetical protein